ncbi:MULTISPECIES: outer membrane beta-barrel protein [Flavobacteriaceae]|uniref:outer membrane beta-barrel protein n=1 Tax=Flavobacteriaceae TaxID=49546 RepID=UPI001492B5D2|nr:MULTISPECIES: outer membrane beta-barrel protein [Allomuricauda]MDC6365494.1 outer membrane beta-barrel protein [Muricauda sp. AC10]
MKKVLLVTLFVGAISLNAQNSENDKRIIPKGTWNIGGDFSFGLSNLESSSGDVTVESDRTTISLFPRVGYAFDDNWMVGLKTGYGYSRFENENNGNFEGKGESITVAPYARRYFGVGNKLLFYLQGELGYTGSWSESFGDMTPRSTSSADEFYVAFRPGVTFFVSNRLAFESSIGALRYSTIKRDRFRSKTFELNLDSSNLLFGLSYYF